MIGEQSLFGGQKKLLSKYQSCFGPPTLIGAAQHTCRHEQISEIEFLSYCVIYLCECGCEFVMIPLLDSLVWFCVDETGLGLKKKTSVQAGPV
jgi:hypothetical protein